MRERLSRPVATLLDDVRKVIVKYIVLADEAAAALALFVAHTYAFAGAHATPYILVVSPEKRSGKTRLLEVLELVCARPWRVVGASEAAIFRKLATDKPTLLLDEVDAIFGSHTERTQPLRAILNAGNRAGASVARCAGQKMDQVTDFEVYSPKVLAGIDTGRLPDTIRDRAIQIRMQRRKAGEQVERLRWRKAADEVEGLTADLASWAETATEALGGAEPAHPEELDDRVAEAWEPLLAIADLAGGEWPEAAREAAIKLSGGEDAEDAGWGVQLLAAIRDAMAGVDRMRTTDLLDAINTNEELPFGGWHDGKGVTDRELAMFLKPYGIRPKGIRIGDDADHRGYLREWFTEAWERWLSISRTQPPQASQAPRVIEPTMQGPHGKADVADVADVVASSKSGGNGSEVLTDAEYVKRFRLRQERRI